MATAQAITWRERLSAYYYLCRFDKPIGTELVFWPTMWALWVAAKGIPDLSILVLMILGVIFMRAAGCAINDFADRKVDAHVERTKTRPLATGIISAKEAVMVFLVLVAASACLLFFLPIETFTGPLEPCFSVHLSVYETLYPFAAGIFGSCIFLVNSNGLYCRRADARFNLLASLFWQSGLDRGL